mmetsp:Transcript_70078/g.169642  ORF Transcript_70078/g.169642 Transcript_70078/m.169642 type:complete len:292 (+) Transcript_70078:303-1178(+)
MSLTVAVLEPLNATTTSMNWEKESSFSYASSLRSLAKMTSAKSTRPTTSTSRSCMVRVASWLLMICTNSCLEMALLPSSSSTSLKIFSSFDFAYCTARSSRSAAATALTTSHKTPISMFITVSVAMRTNTSSSNMRGIPSCWRASASELMSSSRAPLIHRVCMPASTESKYCVPASVPWSSCWKAMAKTYSTTPSSSSIKPTHLAAETMPLTRIMSSGMARRSRAMRAMRVSRTSRRSRSIVFPSRCCPPPSNVSPVVRIAMDMTQVSPTISITRAKSKQNHASLKQFLFS